MSLSLHKFYHDAIARCGKTRERYCQAMFNHLHEVRPDLSEQVRGTDKDPFYCPSPQDPKWDCFVAFIEANWYPPPCWCGASSKDCPLHEPVIPQE